MQDNKPNASEASPVNGVVPPVEYRWKKGQSGNPKGYKKGQKNFKTILKEVLENYEVNINGEVYDGKTALAVKLFQLAMKDENLPAIKEVIDRLEGKATQAIDIDDKRQDSRKLSGLLDKLNAEKTTNKGDS